MNPLNYACHLNSGLTPSRKCSKTAARLDTCFLLERLACNHDDKFVITNEQLDFLPPYALRHCPKPGMEYIAGLTAEDGTIFLLDTRRPASKSKMTTWAAHDNAIFDLQWAPQDTLLATAAGDQSVAFWDIETCQHILSLKKHISSVKCLDFHPTNKCILASGSRDGMILLWDIRVNKRGDSYHPVNIIHNAHDTFWYKCKKKMKKLQMDIKPTNSVTSVLFQSGSALVSSGASDSTIKIWDLRKTYIKSKEPLPCGSIRAKQKGCRDHGYTSLCLNPSKSQVFASSTDNRICLYNLVTCSPEPVSTFYGHLSQSFFVKFELDAGGEYLASGSSDCCAYIWKVSKPGRPVVQLVGHHGEVTSVAWNPTQPLQLISCGDDSAVMTWKLTTTDKTTTGPFAGMAQLYDSLHTEPQQHQAKEPSEEQPKDLKPSMTKRPTRNLSLQSWIQFRAESQPKTSAEVQSNAEEGSSSLTALSDSPCIKAHTPKKRKFSADIENESVVKKPPVPPADEDRILSPKKFNTKSSPDFTSPPRRSEESPTVSPSVRHSILCTPPSSSKRKNKKNSPMSNPITRYFKPNN